MDCVEKFKTNGRRSIFRPLLLTTALFGLFSCQPQALSEQSSLCQPQLQPCQKDGVSFALDVETIEVETALPALITFQDAPKRLIEVKLTGQNMYMGYIPVILTPVNQPSVAQNSGTEPLSEAKSYKGDIYLASCSSGAMRWRLNILYEDPSGTQQQRFFDFDGF
jgi:hypothetical protein